MTDSLMNILAIIFANASMIWWFRKDSKEDWVRMEAAMKESQIAMAAAMKESQTKTDSLIMAIQEEMKDFHRRSLEVEYSIKERLLNLETRGQIDQKPKLSSSKKE